MSSSRAARPAQYEPRVAAAGEAGRGPSGSRTFLFAAEADQPRARRATDVIVLLGCTVALGLIGAVAVPQPGVQRAFESFIRSIPSSLDALWRLLIAFLTLFAIVVLLAALYGRRWSTVRDFVLAGALALCLSLVVSRVVTGSWPDVWDSLRSTAKTSHYPPLALAVSAGALQGVSPDLRRPARRLVHWAIFLAFLGSLLHLTAVVTGAVSALAAATAGAAVVRLTFGSSMGRPSLGDVATALAGLRIPAHALRIAERQTAGVFLVDATDDAGNTLVVKVYGRDAYDTQLVTTMWRWVWYRDAGTPSSFGRLAQAEHEAFLTLLAAQAGIRTDRVVTAGATKENDVLLVLRRTGSQLAAASDHWTAALVGESWRALRQLHDNGISHGQIDDTRLILDGDNVGFADFRGGTIAAQPEQLRSDRAQLLVTTALAVGVESAAIAATRALDPDELTAMLRYVQLPVLTAQQRGKLRSSGLDLGALRTRVAEQAELPAPELEQMRRVTLRAVLQTVMLIVAFYALASVIGGLDFNLLGDQLSHATWWLIIAGALTAQVTRLTNAVSLTGASPKPLPLGPVYALKLAMGYIGFAVPAPGARTAVGVRFHQRHGLAAGTGLAVEGLDGLAQFLLQVILLIGLLTLTSATVELHFAIPDQLILLFVVVLAIAVAVVITLALRAKWRRPIIAWIRSLFTEALQAARGLDSPRRLALLFGGNLATELLFAFALLLFVRGFGYPLGFSEILFITISVTLLAGLMPTPGGIGVAEGGLALGLVGAGMTEEAAFAVVLLYRMATLYLPPIWGYFALRWLERNKHL
jgi:glycosyltransferase 2 family protein